MATVKTKAELYEHLPMTDFMYQVFAHYEHRNGGNYGARLVFDPVKLRLIFEVQDGDHLKPKLYIASLSGFADKLAEIAKENIHAEMKYRSRSVTSNDEVNSEKGPHNGSAYST